MALSVWFERAIFLSSVSCTSVSLIDLCAHGKNKNGISVEIIRLLLEEKVRGGGRRGEVEKRKRAVTLKERDCGSG